MELFVVSSPSFLPNEQDYIKLLIDNGLETLHLRKPNAKKEELDNFLSSLSSDIISRIVLHNHYSLTAKHSFKGIHYNKRSKAWYNDFKTLPITKSISCNSFYDVLVIDKPYDYAFISPVFDSIGKTTFKSAFTESSIQFFFDNHNVDIKLIALGGVDIEQVYISKKLGFSGVAIMDALWNDDTLVSSKSLLKKFNLFKTSVLEASEC